MTGSWKELFYASKNSRLILCRFLFVSGKDLLMQEDWHACVLS